MLQANEFGKAKAERFRARFGLTPFRGTSPDAGDVHDYLHTVLGVLPVYHEDEFRVFQLEDEIAKGEKPLPRGLRFVK